MSKHPIPGKQYVVTAQDLTLSGIAARAYGEKSKGKFIAAANKAPHRIIDQDYIVQGEVLNIPVLKSERKEEIAINKVIDELTIVCGGVQILSESARVYRGIDTLADGWSARCAWQPGLDKEFDEVTLPYAYTPSTVYIGNESIVNGYLYTVEPSLDNNKMFKVLEGWSFTADALESTVIPPYERTKITLKERAEELVEQLGIKVVYDIDDDEVFDRVTANASDTIGNHLMKLASQRRALVTSTPEGDLLITRAENSRSIGTIEEEMPLVGKWSARFDGRKRFHTFKGISQSPLSNSKAAIAVDDSIPVSRFKTIQLQETTEGNIQKAIEWKRTKTIAEALTIPFPVSGWIAPNGEIFKDNRLITVISEAIHVPDGFTFLIKAVEFIYEARGKSAILHLVPPEVYTGKKIIVPWSNV